MKNDHQSGSPLEIVAEDVRAHVRATVTIEGDSLSISYEVTAATDTTLLVFDALPRAASGGSLKYDHLLAYVSYESPDILAVKRVIPRLPTDKDVLLAYVPWAHQATRSSPCRGEIRISLPAEEFNPYYPPGKAAVYRKASARQLMLVLEYAMLDGSLKVIPVPGLDVFRVEGAGAKLHQIRATVLLSNPVPVKRRSDRFEPV